VGAWASVVAVPPARADGAPAPPLAESLAGEALRDYETARGLLLFHDGVGALLRFRGVYEQVHDPRLLANMALCERELGHPAREADLLERALSEGKMLFTPEQRAQAQSLLDAALADVGRLVVTVNVPGAAVAIDDSPVGASPLAGGLRVDRGVHRVDVKKPGFARWSRDVRVTDGGPTAIGVTLVPATVDRAATRRDDVGAPVWLWAVGGAVAAVTIVVAGAFVFHSSEAHSTTGATSSPLTVSW
jgi:hypothetical protein